MRIAIVNDLSMAVHALRRVLDTVPSYQVAWVARDGAEAVDRCAEDTPDLVLMDLIMPVMDGAKATCAIMDRSPCAILVVTATVEGNAPKVFEAMGCGALDAVCTPLLGRSGAVEGGADLLKKIASISRLITRGRVDSPPVSKRHRAAGGAVPLLAVGASTGGPKALARVLGDLSPGFPAAVVVVQHVDVQFADNLASWLNDLSPLPVRSARENDAPEPGRVLLAATNDHLKMGRDLRLHYDPEPVDYPYRPSVDAFFFSLEQHWPGSGTALILTGMGRDGAKGLAALKALGWRTLVQDKETSTVWGMPKAAVELKAAQEVLALPAIGPALVRAMTGTDTRGDVHVGQGRGRLSADPS